MYLNFSIFTVFLKNRNIISKMKRSKVTDYAALKEGMCSAHGMETLFPHRVISFECIQFTLRTCVNA